MSNKNLSKTYSELLRQALDKLENASHEAGSKLADLLDQSAETYSQLAEYTREELLHMNEYLKRDLEDAGQYLQHNREALNDWLGYDRALIEQGFGLLFARAADATTRDLLDLKDQAVNQYRTGQISTLGTLACMQCGQLMQFHAPGRIPPCPHCKGSDFHRVYDSGATS